MSVDTEDAPSARTKTQKKRTKKKKKKKVLIFSEHFNSGITQPLKTVDSFSVIWRRSSSSSALLRKRLFFADLESGKKMKRRLDVKVVISSFKIIFKKKLY